MTPDQFQERVVAAAGDLAFRLAGSPEELQAALINGFAQRVRTQWRSLFTPALSADDVDGMVADVLARVRAKRDRLESFGGGTA
jgi:hypothetical protein